MPWVGQRRLSGGQHDEKEASELENGNDSGRPLCDSDARRSHRHGPRRPASGAADRLTLGSFPSFVVALRTPSVSAEGVFLLYSRLKGNYPHFLSFVRLIEQCYEYFYNDI